MFTIGKCAIGQTIISNNGKYGIVDNDRKNIVIPIEYDTIIEGSKSESYGYIDYAHSFILRKNNKYYFALKKWWKINTSRERADGWRTYPPLEGKDSTKWELFNQEFDTLYRFEKLIVVYHSDKNATIQDYEIYLDDTCFQISNAIYPVIYRKNKKYGLLTFDRTTRIFGRYVTGNLSYKRMEYSIDNLQMYPAKYDSIMYLPIGNGADDNFLVTLNSGKYGLIGLENNIEIEPQFDTVPVKLNLDPNINSSIYKHSYYCVKKNGLWGVVYFNTKSNDFITCIPFNYQRLADIENQNIRSVDFFELFTFDKDNTKQFQYQDKYISCVYNTLEDTVHFNFIIRDGETNSPTKWNNTNNREELNKDYIPPTEKQITFSPTINDRPVVQEKEYEYLCTSNIYNIVNSYSGNLGKLTTPLFFVLKMDRSKDVVNSEYDLYKRGETKKNVVYSAREYTYISPRLNYINRKPKAISVYRFVNDSFIPLSEFNDEDNTTYEVVTEFMDYKHYYTEEKKVTYSSDFILKSTQLEPEKYKHEFYTFKGVKLYEITSKYPIDYWKFIETDPFRTSSYIPDEHFALEFYTEIQGKKKPKKKIICSYNVKTKEFYK